jgi:peptidoglycan/xylan/chitin deacetylase (PgdA/CDA1 family)
VTTVLLIIAVYFVFDIFDLVEEQDDTAGVSHAPPSESITLPADESTLVTILMFHHFAETGDPATVISAELFENHLIALRDAGYTTVSFEDLTDFVHYGKPLPQRPLIITIDDGYLSVYETAFPILKKHDMKATVFIIGVAHGQSYYKDTGHPVTPRFSDAEAQIMINSGLISIQSHSYDMHQYEPFETGPFRSGVLQREDESEEEYIVAFNEDFRLAAEQIMRISGTQPLVYSYPFGFYCEMSESLLKDLGVMVTLTTAHGLNEVVQGSPESLRMLKRFNIPGDKPTEAMLEMITADLP